ncbi:MAG: hypothetical protein ABII18_02355 [bacterium]
MVQNKTLQLIIIFILMFSFTACGGSSSGGGGTEGGDVSAALTQGEAELDAGDISDAQTTYCDEITAGSTDAQIAFGCFLTKLILLAETSDALALFTAVDQDPIDIETDILTDILDEYFSADYYNFVYTEHTDFPFNDILSGSYNVEEKLARIINELVGTDTSVNEFIDLIYELVDDFEELETLLGYVIDDETFTFTIPDGTFYTETDLEATYNDARFFMASIKATIVGINVMAAYDYGVDISKILSDDGTEIDYEILVADLNGTGETIRDVTVDTVACLTFRDETLITSMQETAEEALMYAYRGFYYLNNGETSDFIGTSLNSETLEDMETLLGELYTSVKSEGMVQLTLLDPSTVEVDLYTFFTNPPSSADITSSDPFDYDDEEDKIQIVEAYYRDFLEDIADF